MQLIDATPTHVQAMGKGWCITYGEVGIGRIIGVVYLLADDPHYTRFKIVEHENIPMYEPIGERPLTPEEVEHFEALVTSGILLPLDDQPETYTNSQKDLRICAVRQHCPHIVPQTSSRYRLLQYIRCCLLWPFKAHDKP